MDTVELSNLRRSTADQAYLDFEFDEGCAPEADNGWEDDGLGNFTKTLFIPNQDDPAGPTLKGVFNVTFDPGSVVPDSVWATLDGNDIGRKPAVAASTALGL
ncbi:hypothetical protein [Rhizobium sp. BK176]|uniref:hypothetical protein n=1 Tax=Rhizobium sp. BK176 TaxID=2587071 RepID=UPI002167FFED|nr:hypothetical protein [Rhizobium sp. BK176]MCS4089382.1 hypothetical protein [Rhizobium sp. BK176]